VSVQDGPLGQLVSFDGAGGLRLDGLLFRSPDADTTILHAHGSFGNFYQNMFVRVLAARAQRMNANFISFNLSAHDGVAEGYFADGGFRYVGASLVDFDTCIADIAGAVSFATNLNTRIVLSGHSLGCDRIVAASMHYEWTYPLILLAPCDSYALQSNLISPESVEEQRERLSRPGTPHDHSPAQQYDWLPFGEYGVRSTREWTYPNPITRSAFLSISHGAPYRLFRFEQEPWWRLNARAIVVSPGQDALLTTSHTRVRTFFSIAFGDSTHVVVPGDHLFSGNEDRLADSVMNWLVIE